MKGITIYSSSVSKPLTWTQGLTTWLAVQEQAERLKKKQRNRERYERKVGKK